MNKKPKVLFLASWFPKDDKDLFGKFVSTQFKALSSIFETRLVDCTVRGFFPEKIQTYLNLQKAKREIEKFKPDLIHAQVAYPAGKIAQILKQEYRIPVILTEHTGPIELLLPYFGGKQKFQEHLSSYDQVISVSSFLKKEIQKYNQNVKVKEIGNIVENHFLNEEMFLPKNQNQALYVGGLTKEKGFDLLLNALSIFDRKFKKSLKIKIIGNGDLLIEAKKMAQNLKSVQIEFLDFCPRDQLAQNILEASFLILPSRYETFSLIAAECIALGRPVLGLNSGGPEDFVAHERGVLLTNFSEEDFADQINEFAYNPKWQADLNQMTNRRTWIKENYSENEFQKNIQKIYQEVLSK